MGDKNNKADDNKADDDSNDAGGMTILLPIFMFWQT